MLYKDAVYKDAVQECLEAEGVRFTKKRSPLDGGITVQGILPLMCTPLMATLVKGHIP